MVFAYVVICLCWCILGAVLNPEVFLPFAAAAATFIIFIFMKISSSITLVREVMRELVSEISNRMKSMLNNMLDKVISTVQGNQLVALANALESG
jgi:hypothetical protein